MAATTRSAGAPPSGEKARHGAALVPWLIVRCSSLPAARSHRQRTLPQGRAASVPPAERAAGPDAKQERPVASERSNFPVATSQK